MAPVLVHYEFSTLCSVNDVPETRNFAAELQMHYRYLPFIFPSSDPERGHKTHDHQGCILSQLRAAEPG